MSTIDSQITFCSVSDLQRTSRFWGDVIGLPLVVDQGTCRIYRSTGEAYLGFCEREEPIDPAGVILTIVSPEVDAWHDRLRQAGVEMEHPPRHNPTYGIYHFFARDPDGYRVEIQQFDDSSWNARASSSSRG
ncbi:MAG: VOC family protein [Phycisphaerales bacterium]|nr:VOC family protein [Phycisphaerales bacterium]